MPIDSFIDLVYDSEVFKPGRVGSIEGLHDFGGMGFAGLLDLGKMSNMRVL